MTSIVSLSAWTYTKAEGTTLEVCVKKSGLIYVIGEEFRRSECKKNDSLLSWNTAGIQGLKGDTGLQGPKGDVGATGPKGDTGATGAQGTQGITGSIGPMGLQGAKGDSASNGAGNIAFCSNTFLNCQVILKTDGTIWEFTDPTWIPTPNVPKTIPVAVSDVVLWDRFMVLDKNGDVWRWSNNHWNNVGHPN
jgi:hypothetical protein